MTVSRTKLGHAASSSQTWLCASQVGLDGLAPKVSKWLEHRQDQEWLHVVWLCQTDRFPKQPPAFPGLSALAWPDPLPGLHRLDLCDLPVSLTLAIGPHLRSLAELLVAADWALVDHLEMPIDPCMASTGLIQALDGTQRHPVVVPDPLPDRDAWLVRQARSECDSVLVIGAGISGLTTAAVLAAQGFSTTVVGDPQVHASHWAAALTPVVSADDNSRSRLSRAGALAAARYWRSLPSDIGLACGALQLQRPQGAKRVVDLRAVSAAFDMPAWAQWLEPNQASERAGLELGRGGLWLAGGWAVRVPRLLHVLATQPGVNVMHGYVTELRRQAGQWQAVNSHGDVIGQGHVAVLANAGDACALLQRSELWTDRIADSRLSGLHGLAGEITLLDPSVLGGGPRCIVGGDGYVLPPMDGACVSGGTYVRGDRALCSKEGRATNIARAGELLNLPDLAAEMQERPAGLEPLTGWSGWRAVLPGRLPAIGSVSETSDLWVFTGCASRGLTWSVLGAGLIADALTKSPIRLEKSLISAISPLT
jgi:tRNA 5-methylaminomethyl-2-thiouridine biosynthesis bifunctional protein